MHGLQTIHSQNETAARDARSVLIQKLKAEGKSYIVKLDALGQPDINSDVISFDTTAQLKAHALATIAVSQINEYQLVYGSDD